MIASVFEAYNIYQDTNLIQVEGEENPIELPGGLYNATQEKYI